MALTFNFKMLVVNYKNKDKPSIKERQNDYVGFSSYIYNIEAKIWQNNYLIRSKVVLQTIKPGKKAAMQVKYISIVIQ